MAVRRTILCLGDITAAGRPVSELTAIDPSFDDAQALFDVWNIQAQAWQALTPGVNSNTRAVASDLWSFEARLRHYMPSAFVSDKLYLIKDASATDAADWAPQSGSAFAALVTQVTNAAAAASPDTLSIDGIAISIQALDHLQKDWPSYGDSLFSTIEGLRTALEAIVGVDMGTFRDDSGPTPVVVLEPHYGYVTQDSRLQMVRMQAQTLENLDARVRVVRTHGYSTLSDGTFTAASQVALSEAVADCFFEASFNDEGADEAMLVGLFGDSTVEGYGPVNASLPSRLQAAIAGAMIWRPVQGSFATLQAGVNNQISVSSHPYHGYEISLADRLRDDQDIWIVKGTQVFSVASNYRGMLEASSLNVQMASWGANHRGLSDHFIRGYFKSAIEALRTAGRKPTVGLVVFGLGTFDAIVPGAEARGAVPAIEACIAQVRGICDEMEVDTSALRFVCVVPAAGVTGASASDLEVIRDGLFELSERFTDVNVVDAGAHTSDGVHPDAAGNVSIAAAIYRAFTSSTANSVQPIFAPSMDHLRKALRLSGVSQDNDATAMIDNAVQSAKSRMFGFLGPDKMATLQGIAYNHAPSTTNDYLRLIASETEIKIVRAELIRSLPLMFKDGNQVLQSWNEEGAFRESGFLQVEKELKRLNEEIETNLGMLARAELGASAAGGSVSAFPLNDNDSPGSSIFAVI